MPTFIISDTHFGHDRIYTFLGVDGAPVRPMISAAEGDAVMIERWNQTVRPDDEVWHLGDVAWSLTALRVLDRLNGVKHLILGNHDSFELAVYSEHFASVQAAAVIEGALLTHYPVHDSQFAFHRLNLHGHIHERVIDDPRYVNLSVERTGYRPVLLEEALSSG